MKKYIKIIFVVLITFLFASCESNTTYELPNLENKSKLEILNIFLNIDQTIKVDFEYEFSTEINAEIFIGYKNNLKPGDEKSFTDEIIIVLSKGSFKLPDLNNYTKTDIEAEFTSLLADFEGIEIELEFKYIYDSDYRPNRFIRYESNQVGDKIISSQKITIVLSGPENNLPDLTGKTETQIIEQFNTYKTLYENFDTTLNFTYQYSDTVEAGTFIAYDNDLEIDGPLVITGQVDIIIAIDSLKLPDFSGYTKSEMEDYFEQYNIPSNKIEYRAILNENVEPTTFIEYQGYDIGDTYNFKNNNILYIYYDNSILLPDLEGLNKYQIIEELNLLNIRLLNFEYIIDNDFEFDTFAKYGGSLEIGSPVRANQRLDIYLNYNTDVNLGEFIINEYELFISKYISSTYGIGIELFNGTSSNIDLSNYYIAIIKSNSFTPNETVILEGILEPNETFVIINDQADQELLDKADLITHEMNFGVNDTIQLRKTSNNTYIDAIYEIGNVSVLMDKEIFVRRGNITHGRRDYTYLEWMGYVPGHIEVVGTHPADGPADPVFKLIADKTFQEFGMTKVQYLSAADGDTVYFKSLDSRDTTSYIGNDRMRFLLVNTPETGKPGVVHEAYANEATNFTVNMLSNAVEIYLQSSEAEGIRDTYGRHLGLVWANVGTIQNPNWKLLNYELLKSGLGAIMIAKSGKYYDHPIFANRYLYQWAEHADNYAKENKLGLYSGVYKS